MARMPQARWLGERSPRNAMSRYDAVCVHTIVGFAPAHAAHFSVHHDGTIDQSRDTRYRSAANLNGNHRVIAIENEDHGTGFPSWSGSNVPALTVAQVEANAQILAWAHTEHGIPLQLCPNSRPTSRGLAYHRQGIDGNFGPFKYGGRVSGGERWSSSFGKVCPGDRRIDQLPAILARAKQIVGGDDEMTPAQMKELKAYIDDRTDPARILEVSLHPDTNEPKMSNWAWSRIPAHWNPRIAKVLGYLLGDTRATLAELSALRSVVGELVERDPSHPLTREDLDAAIELGMQKVRLEVTVVDDELDTDA